MAQIPTTMKAGINQLLPWLILIFASRQAAADRCVRALLFGVALCVAGLDPAAHAAPSEGPATVEQRVKAASLYRFLGYVEWPPASFATSSSPYVIGLFNAGGIADELSRISAGRSINNRPLVVRTLKTGDSLTGLHILFIGHDDRARLEQWLQSAQKKPVLTVTETDGALALGSMINFRLADDRVRFEVALDAMEKSDLKVSSRMLSVALSVSGGTRR